VFVNKVGVGVCPSLTNSCDAEEKMFVMYEDREHVTGIYFVPFPKPTTQMDKWTWSPS